jgi:PRTRC genetic system protein A
MLVQYHFLYPGTTLPTPTGLYHYLVAANGIFLHSQRAELAALLPLTSTAIRGLAPATPYFEMNGPRVPAALLTQMLTQARAARNSGGGPVEILFHLAWTSAWTLTVPPQRQTATQVQLLPLPGWPTTAPLIEIHSHHGMDAFWSGTDDADEVGMALYAVLGRVFDQPQLCVRLGVYGHCWEIPAAWVFEVPSEIAGTYRGDLPADPPPRWR